MIRSSCRPHVGAALAALALLLQSSGPAKAQAWSARQIEVHEWGVQVFDLSGTAASEPLPAHIHTPADAPGAPVTRWSPPVRDLPADMGQRAKPILYFRLPEGETGPIPVSVEVGFSWGDAIAWYPQADYACVPVAGVPEGGVLARWIRTLASDRFEEREEAMRNLSSCGRMIRPALEAGRRSDDLEVRARTGALLTSFAEPQLRWDRLHLTTGGPVFERTGSTPAAPPLPGEDLPGDHWVKVARQVDAAYVGNGLEAERYLFYEGRTAERPAVTAERLEGGSWILTNGSMHPVHNLFLDDAASLFAYIALLPPGASMEVRPEPWGKISPAERLLECLTARAGDTGNHRGDASESFRDPAQPQGPTTQAWLHPDEARALLDSWGRDFFEGEGTRLVYREDPAALDEAMPLRIYTDMSHTIDLSRAGLVLVKGIGEGAARDPAGRRR